MPRLPRRFHLDILRQKHHPALVIAIFGFFCGSLAIAILAAMARAAHSPLVFPSLGPTAFLLFYKPLSPAASPRNTILGHLVGAAAGYLSLMAFGLANLPPPGLDDITWPRLGAAALSIGGTIGLMELWDVPHPPAGATTLIVSLGLISRLWQIGVLMLAVVALVLLGWVMNHLAGIRYPVWRASFMQDQKPPE